MSVSEQWPRDVQFSTGACFTSPKTTLHVVDLRKLRLTFSVGRNNDQIDSLIYNRFANNIELKRNRYIGKMSVSEQWPRGVQFSTGAWFTSPKTTLHVVDLRNLRLRFSVGRNNDSN